MIRQIILLLSAVTACLALGDTSGYYSKKNAFQQQAPQQYASVASFHASKQAPPQIQQVAQAPSPYSFGYEAEGSSRQESADASGKVTGTYKVTNEDGSTRLVKYVADHQGFRADIDTSEPGTKSENPADVAFKSSAVEKPYEAAPSKYGAQSYGQNKPSFKSHFEQKPIQFTMGNGAYSYMYESQLEDGGRSAHSERSDGPGKVSGFYSMSVPDGGQRKVDYSADNEGFKAAVNTNEFGTKSESPAHVQFLSAAAPLQGHAGYGQQPSAFQPQQQAPQYSPTKMQQQPIQQAFEAKPSPYAFSYDAQLQDGSSSRTESADASGKVVGSYSLTADDGRQRTINYVADQNGFRANVDTNEFGTKSDSPADVQFLSSAPKEKPVSLYAAAPHRTHPAFPLQKAQLSGSTGVKSAFQSPQPAPAAFPVQQEKLSSGAGVKSTFMAPQAAASGPSSYMGQSSTQYNSATSDKRTPYSFNYVADLDDGSSSRSESGDESGKVIGSYSLSVADGRSRKVDYIADHNGFRATVNTNEFGTKNDSPADVQLYSSATFDEPAPYSSPNAYKASPSTSGATMYGSTFKTQQQAIEGPTQFGSDGSYAYNYNAMTDDGGSSARSESADASGNVNGFYSMSIPDGRKRKVDYTADSTGFKASVDTNEFGTKSDSPAHVRFMSSAPQEAPRTQAAFKAQTFQKPAQKSSGMHHASFVTQQRVEAEPSYQPSPYAFNYEAAATGGSSARKESADGSGTVTGSYTVRNEDGSLRVVEYIADKSGFRANVKTNEPGTKSDDPAHVTFKSEAPAAPLQQSPVAAQFPSRSFSQKTSMVSQKAIDAWSR